jgi:excinuclease ABC subunit A
MAEEFIRVRGARAHNLKNINLDIPKNKLVVITGLSGSGKSSLAFDTIYAEGQRRYVESLSAYARQFLGLMEKPDVDLIEGLSPAISIDQKSAGHNPRSTVGTVTEIYDYLRLLYARVGHPRSPVTGERLTRQTVQQIVDRILHLPQEQDQPEVKIMLLAPLVKNRKGTYEELFARLLGQGYVRARVNKEIYSLEEDIKLDRYQKHSIEVVVDRLIVKPADREDKEFIKRLTDSVELTLNLGEEEMLLNLVDSNEDIFFSEKLVDPASGQSFPEIEPHTFSFNSPHGACPTCSGLGVIKEIDPLAIYNPRLTIAEGGIYPWSRSADNMDSWYMKLLGKVADEVGFSLRTPLGKLSAEHLQIILYGNGEKIYNLKFDRPDNRGVAAYNAKFEGVIPNLLRRYQETDSDQIRKEIEEYMDDKVCNTCKGYRLKLEALSVTIRGLNIVDVGNMSIQDAFDWVTALQQTQPVTKLHDSIITKLFTMPPVSPEVDDLTGQEIEIAKQVFKEILDRLNFLVSVGLNYLNLNRSANTLSGGESQRIRLASQIGTGLSGVLYVLDEPSIGLHQRDNDRLLATLERLKQLGNSVLVVEHDDDTIKAADYVIDMGPGAGEHGGEVAFAGTYAQMMQKPTSITGEYLAGKKQITNERLDKAIAAIGIKAKPKNNPNRLRIFGATHHNLKNVDLEIPLGKFIAVTGVSGSGKSSLINDILYPVLARELNGSKAKPGTFREYRGVEHLDKIINIDQSPIGRTPRSNPATYTGVFTEIRNIFAMTSESKTRGYKPGRFSFNVKGGRCEHCQGDGVIRIEMQFLPDVYVTCEVCNGQRYNRDTLQIDYKGKNIAQVLEMTIEEATEFFTNITMIHNRLKTLMDVGLGYIRLGQSATTLSGGEAQRIKLAAELSKRSTGKTMYILDEPSTGLHFDDIYKLLIVLHSLVAQGNSVLVIEHNLHIVKTADWVIDLGPEGGDKGGEIIAEGTVEQIINTPNSYTGQWLKKMS